MEVFPIIVGAKDYNATHVSRRSTAPGIEAPVRHALFNRRDRQ
jgi:hypothetical protein